MPRFDRTIFNMKAFRTIKKGSFSSLVPSVFVGSYNYPDVNIGILSNEAHYVDKDTENYSSWIFNKLSMNNIIDKRCTLINSKFNLNVKLKQINNMSSNFDSCQEMSLSNKFVDVELSLKDTKISSFSNFDNYMAPYGPSTKLSKISVSDNISVPTVVDKVVSDTDLVATKGITKLYSKGFDENYISKAFSLANFGVSKKRRVVPTKWSITAVDDNIGKSIIKSIYDNVESNMNLFVGGYLGNYFLILVTPGNWAFELVEIMLSNGKVTSDFEFLKPKTSYAVNCTGGYYAARLAVLDYLKSVKRVGKVLVIRFITDDYYMSLGVWVVRETVRKVFRTKRYGFDDRKIAFEYCLKFASKNFGYNLKPILDNLNIYNFGLQKGLFDF